MAYAIDNPSPTTIMLISGDRDFVYAVSILSLRQYRIVLLSPRATHISLKAQASAVYHWPDDVLPDFPSPDTISRPRTVNPETLEDFQRYRSQLQCVTSPPPAAYPKGAPPSHSCHPGRDPDDVAVPPCEPEKIEANNSAEEGDFPSPAETLGRDALLDQEQVCDVPLSLFI